MNNLICQICNNPLVGGHTWKEHKIKEEDYFLKYIPRYSKYSGKLIPFKNREFYLTSDFQDKKEMVLWFKQFPEEAKIYAIELLRKRKEKKGLIYAPSQLELKLCSLPSVQWYDENLDSYNNVCESLGLKTRYKNKISNKNILQSLEIIEDTREKINLCYPDYITVINKKLDYGDLCLSNNTKIVIERKSLNDACGSLSRDYERLRREFLRAKKDKGYIIFCIEESFKNFQSIAYLPHTKKVQASFEFLSHRLRDLLLEFNNSQACFCNGRKHMTNVVEFILKQNKNIKKLDIQLLIDKKYI